MIRVKKINFKAELIKEYSAVSRVDSLGEFNCTMELFLNDSSTKGYIEWVYGSEVTHIGIWIDSDREISDYDGVFSLPDQAIDLLNQCNIKTNNL